MTSWTSSPCKGRPNLNETVKVFQSKKVETKVFRIKKSEGISGTATFVSLFIRF